MSRELVRVYIHESYGHRVVAASNTTDLTLYLCTVCPWGAWL